MRAQGLCVPFVRSAAEAIAPPLEEMADIQYNRAGISARDPATGVRHQISRLRNGVQRLTGSGRRLLDADFVDFMIHVPTTEQQVQNADHPVDARPRERRAATSIVAPQDLLLRPAPHMRCRWVTLNAEHAAVQALQRPPNIPR